MAMTSGGGGAAPNINVTPLIDILLVLLIIFMVISPLKPARFKALVPENSKDMSSQAKQSPQTLVVDIKGADPSAGAVLLRGGVEIAHGSVSDPGPIASALATEFKTRKDEQRWKTGFENQVQLSPDERIERTVFVKAPESQKYGNVVKVIDAAKGAGANPVGLQTEALDQ
ncbi:MAG TPA: biopolymer transporter ExbD [Pyrinomonadaceae bacterium]|nr:biopolymer transporter ExbD [Pyrinomonadaceae bacterium]